MRQQSSIAIISPALGGGVARHTKEMVEAWSQQSRWVLFLESSGRLINTCIMKDGEKYKAFTFLLPGNEHKLLQLMRVMHIGIIHYHQFIHMESSLLSLPQVLNIPFCVTLHDYFTVCPLVNLVNKNGEYCGECGEEQCMACLQDGSRNVHNHIREWPLDIVKWRHRWQKFLFKAATVYVPQDDVKQRMRKYFSNIDFRVFENPEIITPDDILQLINRQRRKKTQKIRQVGLIGAITPIKGAEVVIACARKAAEDNLPLHFVLFGTLQLSMKEKLPANLTICGAYQEADVYRQIVDKSIDFFWFPCTCPETYSYTLSIPIRLHIPVLGSDIGAVGNRINMHHWGQTYPLGTKEEALCHRLLSFRFTDYVAHDNVYELENTSFPFVEQLYGSRESVDFAEIDMRKCDELFSQMKSSLEKMKIANIIGIEYRAIFRQKKSWGWKLRTLFYVDKQWLKHFMYYTDKKVLWNKVKKMIVG